MALDLKEKLKDLRGADCSFIDEARRTGRELKVGQTRFVAASEFQSEKSYKKAMSKKGRMMYHFHLCCENNEVFKTQIRELDEKLSAKGLCLDRFGISIDPAMALPADIREKNKKGGALYFAGQEDWDMLGMSEKMQPHLGDNMIGSPASYEIVQNALKAGVTTIGNVSQFFGYEYPEFSDVDARTRSTLQAMAVMAENVDAGTLIHSNLDDGYGDKAADLGLLIGCALLEKYLVEDLMGAKIAHSYGDMFFSPEKRLIFLSALKTAHKGDLTGSMVFTNKLGRNSADIERNTPHLCMSVLCDMAGQYVYQTGHAIATMANQGLTTDVTTDEVVRTLEYAKELEAYIPDVVSLIDFDKIDRRAKEVYDRGEMFFESTLEVLSDHIDIDNPYAVLSALKRVGIGNLTDALGRMDRDSIIADYNLFEHDH
ncbi:hypothetical protein [Bacilliculturomica massiliensis]|uniref:hypothetical protein n=1 Tax=Bacilliculturomica massiliensis TaxID=1917867 RepID=UPI001031C55E|nr:hypothetical protein [Bacilliculturomica massiliensis]